MRNLGWIRSIALFLSSVIAITAAQRNNDFDSGPPPGVIAGIVISVVIFIVISGIMISIPICVLCCAAHRARGQQMPTTIVATTPASSVPYQNMTTGTAMPYSTTTTAPYPTNPPPIPGQYAYPKQAAYPPEPSDPTLTAEAPPSYNLAADYPAPPTNQNL